MGETKKSATALAEEMMLKLWATEKVFEKSLRLRKDGPYFSFYDGPPFASGEPHYGHLEQTTVKDAIARYKTMQGFRVPRRTGWDTHGLPIEYQVEKELGLNSKRDILDYGIAKFNDACRAIVFRHQKDFDQMYERMGRWQNPAETYATLNTDYIESVWWVLSEVNRKDLLYKGFKSMPYCPRCETPLSNFELNDGYRDNVPDPSVFVLFPLKDDPNTKLLAWTTTPWTLPANAALAVDKKADYAYVKLKTDDSVLILAKDRVDLLDLRKHDYGVLKTVKGRDLIGLRYEPLYGLDEKKFSQNQLKNAWQVFHDDSVDLEDGTGVLHSAPRYGEADLNMGLVHDLPLVESVNGRGHLTWGPKEALGKFFKAADDLIIADLTKKDRIFAAETAEHTYPFCWRCETPLMYFATTTWFVAVSKIRDQLLKTAQQINWIPGHVKSNRFGKWLEGARDWAISRNRYWGAPLPIWVNTEDENDYIVVGSLEELKKLADKDIKRDDLHRPLIDQVTFKKGAKTYKRVEEVIDCWFESGSMPYGQDHYPFENQAKFKNTFPADFIVEAVEQVHLWFYTLHVLATALFQKPAYKNVIADGLILAADGKKLSKRLRNYPPIEVLLDEYGADVVRFFVLSSPLMTGEDTRMSSDIFRDIYRNVFMTLQHSFSFFKTYAEVDNWRPNSKGLSLNRGENVSVEAPVSDNILDQWILARLNQATAEVTKEADNYRLSKATKPIAELIEDLSNWYIRRSRRRFWKSENDKDKNQAYATLHYVLTVISQLLAPWAPFIADELWRELTNELDEPKSVHLTDWPSVKEPDKASTKVLEEMKKVRQFVAEGLAKRAEARVKIRQPLSKITLPEVDEEYRDLIAEELNVKEIIIQPESIKLTIRLGESKVLLDTRITDELKSEGVMRELVRHVQNARKNAKLNVEDRIQLRIVSDSAEITEAVKKFKDTIYAETLATAELKGEAGHSEKVKIESQEATISLKRAGN